jgi:hypothetical protein
LYTTQVVNDFLSCTGQDERVCQEVRARMMVVTRDGEFPEFDIRYVMETNSMITAFHDWIAGLHSFNERWVEIATTRYVSGHRAVYTVL